MTTEGIEAVFVETRNWGNAAGFFQALGFELDFATDHSSGLPREMTVRDPDGHVWSLQAPVKP
jgi:hypothetical protein